MKKWVKGTIATVITGGIAAGIAVPLTLSATEVKELQDFQKINMNQEAWPGITLQQLIDGVKKQEEIRSSLVSKLSEVAAFSIYNKEQVGSVELQKQNFMFQIWKIDKQLAEKKADGTDKYTGETRKQMEDNKTKLNNKLSKINNGLSDEDYKNISFSNDYPLIFMKQNIIQQRQNDILQDIKSAYIKQFATKSEGENAWINELKRKYNGATSDAEAVSQLVYGIIKNNAYSSTKFKLDSTYTVEQRLYAEEEKKAGRQTFSFLLNVYLSTDVQTRLTNTLQGHANGLTDSDKASKLFFISSNSKQVANIYVDPDAAATQLESLKLVKTSHALIAAKQNAKGFTLPWTINKEALIGKDDGSSFGILGFYGASNKKFFSLLNDLKSSTTTDDGWHGDFKTFVEKATGQPSASKDGFLGMKEKIESVIGMDKSFAIGSIEAMYFQERTSSIQNGAPIIDYIVNKITDWMSSNSITNQESLTQKINSMSDAEITQDFGSIFRDAFSQGTETKPRWVYHVAGNVFIVTSSFGVHFLNIENQDKNKIKSIIEEDISKSFDEQTTSSVKLNYSELINKYKSENDLLKSSMSDSNFITKLKTGYEKPSDQKLDSDLPDQFAKDGTTKLPWSDVLTLINDALDNVKSAAKNQLISQALDQNFRKQVEDKYDQKLIQEKVGGTGSDAQKVLTAEEIYSRALQIEGVMP